MNKSDRQKVLDAGRLIDEHRQTIKDLYKEIDRLTTLVSEPLLTHGTQEYAVSGLEISLKDNFENTNTIFRTAAFRRYEVEINEL